MPDTEHKTEHKTGEHKQGEERIPKKGGKLDKYKWWIIGGMAVISILVFYFVRKSNSNAASQTGSPTPPGIDPSTGVPYAQEYGTMGYGGFGGGGFGGGGGTGPTGARGPRGPRGPRGNKGPRGHRGPHDRDRRPIPHKPRNPRHQAALAGGMLTGHNNRIIPAANRRPVPRIG